MCKIFIAIIGTNALRLAKEISKILKNYCNLIVFDNGEKLSLPTTVAIYPTTDTSTVSLWSGAITVIGDIKNSIIVNNCNCVVPLSCAGLVKANKSVITCGMSLRDALTLSSSLDEVCTVSLQRSVTKYSGKIAEPFEIPVKKIQGVSDYALLSAMYILIYFDLI